MMMITATYSPEDNKLRLYASARLDNETYQRVRAAGFRWAPKQELFVAPSWSPEREDLALELAGSIDDEDTSLVERAEAKAERLEDLSARKAEAGNAASAAVKAIADNIPFGQPILVGHHSEKRARKDAERIQNGMAKAVANWKAAEYWMERAKGALRLAKYKERPDVRARRIKGLESEIRVLKGRYTPRYPKAIMQSRWNDNRPDAPKIPHVYCGLGSRGGSWVAVEDLPKIEAGYKRWIDHLELRIGYEKAMLAESGGLVAEQVDIAVGGRVLVRGEWVTVLRLNKKAGELVSVTTTRRYVPVVGVEEVKGYEPPSEEQAAAAAARNKKGPLCNYNGPGFIAITKAEYAKVPKDRRGQQAIQPEGFAKHQVRIAFGVWLPLPPAPADDHYSRTNYTHKMYPVFITDEKVKQPPAAELTSPAPALAPNVPAALPARREEPKTAGVDREQLEQMQAALKAGVKVVAANQLFPTPPDLARKMADAAGCLAGRRVLEPSAGTGNLITAAVNSATGFDCGLKVTAVEINSALCSQLGEIRRRTLWANEDNFDIVRGDFLEQNGNLGSFDAVLMNPPFENGADIKHIKHALHFLKPGGRLVAICANGPRQQEQLKPIVEQHGGTWEVLPAGTFANQGTQVNTVLLSFTNSEVAA